MFGRTPEEPPPEQRLAQTGATTVAVDPEPAGPREGLILLLFAIVTLAVSAYVLIGEEHDALHDPAQKAARGEVRGLDELSLMREDNLRRVLATVHSSKRPLVHDVRVSPTRADLQVSDPDGSQKILSFDPGFGQTERDFGVSVTSAVPTSRIDAGAPERFLRAVAERTGRPVTAVDYATTTFTGAGDSPTWFLALKEGPARDRQWLADEHGRDIRRSGELAPSVKAANDRRQRAFEARQKRLQRTLRKRSACLSRATDAQAAARCLQRYPL